MNPVEAETWGDITPAMISFAERGFVLHPQWLKTVSVDYGVFLCRNIPGTPGKKIL
jgi:hypothetical protein